MPLLAELPADVLEKLQPNLFEGEFKQGELILREGEYCDGAYYLLDGLVEVRFGRSEGAPDTMANAEKQNARSWATLKGGKKRATAAPVNPTATVLLPEIPVDLTPGERTVLERGEIFGEGSALSRYPIATDITAASAVKCASS